VVDHYLKDLKDARLAANRDADAELAMSRHQAAAEAALRVTEARTEAGKATRVAAATPLPQPSPLAVPPQQQVAQVAQEVAPQPAKRPVLARMVSTVTRIPGWVSTNVVGAAAWVVDLPGQVVRLPERRFL
jgi:Tfp pilus assembly protein PilX